MLVMVYDHKIVQEYTLIVSKFVLQSFVFSLRVPV